MRYTYLDTLNTISVRLHVIIHNIDLQARTKAKKKSSINYFHPKNFY